jgi:hypothetical protein
VRRRLAYVPLLAALLVVPGCQWLFSPPAVDARSPEAQAKAEIRDAIPAIEAFYAENGTYAGITVSGLRTTYDPALPDVRVVVTGPDGYCVESDVDGSTYSLPHPRGAIRRGTCPEAPPQPPGASDQLRTVVVVMESWFAQQGSFEGVTPQWLRSRIPGLRPVRVVEAEPATFCIELTGEGHTYSARGPSGDVSVGSC